MTRSAEETRNLAVVLEMYQAVFGTFDIGQIERFFSPNYRQHSLAARDGRQGLKELMLQLKQTSPQIRSEVRKAFADGDHVIVHVHGRAHPQDNGVAVVDIFRLDDGLIVEHWDVVQRIPEVLPHANGVF